MYNKTYNMKSEGNAFMRKGQAGNWRSKMTEEQVKRFEEWEEKWLKDSDLAFKYD